MADQILEGVNPTRMELLEIKKKLLLAEKGHKLLEEKRDALVEKFFSIIEKRNQLKTQIDTGLHDAFLALITAQMILGEQQVDDAAESTPPIGEISFDNDNIMGVKIARIITENLRKTIHPHYGFSETCAALDDAYKKFNDVLPILVAFAEVEGNLKSLSVEIEKTKRRVNVLENSLIPKLLATIRYIEMLLDEREREDFFRRKRIKALLEGKKVDYAADRR
ncbi:MAG: V-type ATP synthase subunit D [Methanobacteriota archaeon]